jgi:hypothetical protein
VTLATVQPATDATLTWPYIAAAVGFVTALGVFAIAVLAAHARADRRRAAVQPSNVRMLPVSNGNVTVLHPRKEA